MASDTEQKHNRGPVRLGDILRALVEKTTGRSLPAQQNLRVFEVWDHAVGAQVAKVAKPHSFHNGRLFVGTSHPTWVTELSFRREEIRIKLNTAIGYNAVHEIVFRLSRK